MRAGCRHGKILVRALFLAFHGHLRTVCSHVLNFSQCMHREGGRERGKKGERDGKREGGRSSAYKFTENPIELGSPPL